MADFPLIDQASLVMVPSATKEGKLYSQLPTDGSGDFTFTRATSATRVNEEGYIEKGYENLLLQSNQFDTLPWKNANATPTSGQSGYDGSNNAWLLEANTTGQNFRYYDISVSSVYTISIYAKAGTTNWFFFYAVNGGGAWFDLENGVVGILNSGVVSSSIESVGDGWYRCSATYNGNLSSMRIYLSDGNNNVNSTTGANIYIQDAQLNQGLVAYPYLETTTAPVYGGLQADQPRLDYTDASCPSVLIEPSRTNLAAHSEYLGSWTGTGFNKNFGFTSPEGIDNAYEVRVDSAGGTPSNIGPQLQVGISASTKYTVSAFVKPLDTLNEIRIVTYNDDAQRGGNFNFDNNTFTALNTSQETGEVVPFGDDGWYRVSFTYTSGTDISIAYRICFPIGTVRDGNTAFLLYGFQVEEGSFPTSYIPTHGSAQTRAAETLSNAFSAASTGTISLSLGELPQPYLTVLGESFEASTTKNNIAIAYSPTALKISLNGSIVVDATGTYDTSSLSSLQLGHDNGSDQGDNPIKDLIMFNAFLTDTELNALTV